MSGFNMLCFIFYGALFCIFAVVDFYIALNAEKAEKAFVSCLSTFAHLAMGVLWFVYPNDFFVACLTVAFFCACSFWLRRETLAAFLGIGIAIPAVIVAYTLG